MQINVVAPGARAGVVECPDDGGLSIAEGDFSLEEMAEDLRRVKPNSATGDVNTLQAEAVFVLRSLEHVGWQVEWPEVEGEDDEPDDEPGIEMDVN